MNSNALLKVKKKNAAYKRYLSTREGKDYDAYAKARNQANGRSVKPKESMKKDCNGQMDRIIQRHFLSMQI